MPQTYLFYDIETSGLNPCFDQVFEFAAIRTDLEFNEIERIEFYIRLNRDVIPAPAALITHRIGLEQLQQGLNEFEAMQKIHALFNTPGTISLGYNSLGFDDEFLRFSFYRNLLPPYTHQYANGCHRMDLYPMAVMYRLFKPQVLEWPQRNGRTSLKLEDLCAQNNLCTGQSHRALFDVEVTLALAKRLAVEKSMWVYLSQQFSKEMESTRISRLPFSFSTASSQHQEALLVHGKLGHEAYHQAWVISLGTHQHYRNQTLWLRLDKDLFENLPRENFENAVYVMRKRWGESPFLLPIEPRFLTHFSTERLACVEKNKAFLMTNAPLLKLLVEYHQHLKYTEVPEADADARLYNLGFPTTAEERLYQKWRSAEPEKKFLLLDQLSDPVRKTLALRVLMRHWPQVIPADFFAAAATETLVDPWLSRGYVAVDYKNQPHLTVDAAQAEVAELRHTRTLDDEQQALLTAYEHWLVMKTASYTLEAESHSTDLLPVHSSSA